ncbi:hypothetical protein [Candidatus Skiveiella danica]
MAKLVGFAAELSQIRPQLACLLQTYPKVQQLLKDAEYRDQQ